MKIYNAITAAVALACASNVIATTVLGQAGDIAVGAPYYLSKGHIASYYKEGKEGIVSFHCTLNGDGNLVASLYTGKNFNGNAPRRLVNGYNGPFTWKLRNLGEENGNIKVKLIVGNFATLQCQQDASYPS